MIASSLDIRTLRTFVALLQEQSFSKAARRLGLTQSAVSHSFKSLEEGLGCKLLFKAGRRLLPTPQGKLLLQRGETILRDVERTVLELQQGTLEPRGELRIGCSTAGSQFILPAVLREFKDCFPRYTITVRPGDTPDLVEEIGQGRIDVALCIEPKELGHLRAIRLFRDELFFLVSSHHPWARGGVPARREEIRAANYILYNRRSATFRIIEDFFLKQGVKLASFIEMGSFEAIKELVKLGLGVGVMTPWVARPEIESGSLTALTIRPRGIHRQWSLLTIEGRPMNLAEETFAGLCMSACGMLHKGLEEP